MSMSRIHGVFSTWVSGTRARKYKQFTDFYQCLCPCRRGVLCRKRLPANSLKKCVWTVLRGAAVQQVELNLVRALRQSSCNPPRQQFRLWSSDITQNPLQILSLVVKLTCRQGKLPNNGLSSSIRRRSAMKSGNVSDSLFSNYLVCLTGACVYDQVSWRADHTLCAYLYSGWCRRRWTNSALGLCGPAHWGSASAPPCRLTCWR